MPKLDDIISQLRRRREEVEHQVAELTGSEGTTEDLIEKLRELRRRQEATDPGRSAN